MYQPVGKTLFPLLVVEPSEHVKGAPARQAAADRELRDKLIAATGGNVIRGPGIDDVSPIRAAMEVYSGRADLVRDPVQNRQQALSAERARNIVA